MVRNCVLWDESVLGKRKLQRSIMSRLFGKVFLKGFVKDESPLKKYLPAVPELKVTKNINSDLESEKKKWISLVSEYPQLSNHNFILPFSEM